MNPGTIARQGTPPAGGSPDLRLRGAGVSPGAAAGVAVLLDRLVSTATAEQSRGADAERQRLEAALAATRDQIRQIAASVAARAGQTEAAIFQAQLQMLDDPAFLTPTLEAVEQSGLAAEIAVSRTVTALAEKFAAMKSEYLRTRSADVRDLAHRLLANLSGVAAAGEQAGPAVLVAADLLPSDIAGRNPETIAAVVSEQGGATSHGTILCRSLGIPAVAGIAGLMEGVRAGDMVFVDGATGEVSVYREGHAPPLPAGGSFTAPAARAPAARAPARDAAPAVTRDGVRVEVPANIAVSAEASNALAAGADGVGLFRTEFLFLARGGDVPEDEQFTAYKSVLEIMAPARVTVRLLDAGGDKELSWLNLPPERNSFLGLRGIRLLSVCRGLFRTQLRALLRAARFGNLAIMLPMVSNLSEVRATRELLDEVRRELAATLEPAPQAIPLGVMIETPAAALMARELAAEVDFFSIGTNDLTQYVFAVDRLNSAVAGLYQPLHPAVLRLIAEISRGAASNGKTVAMCGEAAADALATPLWVGLGVRELSVQSAAVPSLKNAIRCFAVSGAEQLAQRALAMREVSDVTAALADFARRHREHGCTPEL